MDYLALATGMARAEAAQVLAKKVIREAAEPDEDLRGGADEADQLRAEDRQREAEFRESMQAPWER